MKSNDTQTAEELKKQFESCLKFLEEDANQYNGLKEPLNLYHIARFINKQLYWHYEFITNYEYLTNSEIISTYIKKIIINHTQFLLNIIDDNLSVENAIKSVINELTNNEYINDIKPLKKER